MEQDGAYNRLLDWCYANESDLPSDRRLIYKIGRADTASEEAAIDHVISVFWAKTRCGYTNKRTKEEITREQKRICADGENGKKGGRPKTQRITPGLFPDNPMANPNERFPDNPTANPNERPPAPAPALDKTLPSIVCEVPPPGLPLIEAAKAKSNAAAAIVKGNQNHFQENGNGLPKTSADRNAAITHNAVERLLRVPREVDVGFHPRLSASNE